MNLKGSISRATRSRGERGVTGVEFLVIMGVVVFAFLLMLQYTAKIYAERVAHAAAEEGAAAARRFDGSATAGTERAHAYLDRLSGAQLSDTAVAADRGAQRASVTVSGTAMEIIPFMSLRISETSTGPVERFVPEGRANEIPSR